MSHRINETESAMWSVKIGSIAKKRLSDEAKAAAKAIKTDSTAEKRLSEDDMSNLTVSEAARRASLANKEKTKPSEKKPKTYTEKVISEQPRDSSAAIPKQSEISSAAIPKQSEISSAADPKQSEISSAADPRQPDISAADTSQHPSYPSTANDKQMAASKNEADKKTDKSSHSKDKSRKTKVFDEERENFDAVTIAEKLLDMYDIININDRPHIYIEKYGFWKLISDEKAYRDLKRILPRQYKKYASTKAKQGDIYYWLISEAPSYDYDYFIDRKQYINLADCAISVIDGKIIKDRKHLYFQFFIDVTYDECFNDKADRGLWKRLTTDIFGNDKETIEALEEMIGLTISCIRDKKYSFFLYGKPNTGKSVILNLLQGLMGKQYVSHVAFSQLNDEFSVAMLEGKFLNISGEISGIGKIRLERFKSLTGNDIIVVSHKGQQNFELQNQALLVFACNNMPEVAPEEIESFASRIVVFPFKNSFDRAVWTNDLVDKLLSEPGAIIEAAIRGIIRLQKNNYVFDQSKAMIKCKREFVGEYNSFWLFCEEHIRISEKSPHVKSKTIKEAYKVFCNLNDFEPVSDPIWAKILKSNFSAQSKTKNNARGYIGIELVNLNRLNSNTDETIDYNYPLDEGVI